MNTDKYVQYGCGLCAPATWRNYDSSPTLRIQRIPLIGYLPKLNEFPTFPNNVEYGDIVNGLPVEPNSCKGIYCSHVLEHLSLSDLRVALRHTYSYLMNDGIFRFVLPDLNLLAQEYVQSQDPNASIRFMEHSGLGVRDRARGIVELLRQALGNSSHLWMWDSKSLALELANVGFREIRQAEFHDSVDPLFREVEDPDRWTDSLGMECIK